jgi:hypothetical protein
MASEMKQTAQKLTAVGSAEFNGLFRLSQPILRQRARKDGQGDLANIKRKLEQG